MLLNTALHDRDYGGKVIVTNNYNVHLSDRTIIIDIVCVHEIVFSDLGSGGDQKKWPALVSAAEWPC